MKKIALAVSFCISIIACRDGGERLRGTAVQKTSSGTKPAPGAVITLYSLQDSTKSYSAVAASGGDWHIDGVPSGSYLRVAASDLARQTPLGFLRELVLESKSLQSISGYDVVSNMSDELKAAIAFNVEQTGDTAVTIRVDSVAREFIDHMPEKLRRMFPDAGRHATTMRTLTVPIDGRGGDEVVFE